MRKILLATTMLCAVADPALATEGGASQYPNGAEDFMVGAMPPPGWYLINYTAFYQAGRLNDGYGNKTPNRVEANVFADTARMIYSSPYQILGGTWATHVLVPWLRLDATMNGSHVSQNGIGDITFAPFVLAWHTPNVHYTAGVDFIAPTGHFDRNAFANIGANYWGIEPAIGITYLSDSGFELSSKFMYTTNTENTKTDYSSGDAFHMDYTIGQHFGPLAVGIGGYVYSQLTEDEQNGSVVATQGNKGKAYAIGPQVKWDIKPGFSLTGKWQHEFAVENRLEGDKFWAKLAVGF